ncbi:MAG: hypothetical protein ACLR7L_03830 [Enterocloster sp.]|nr:MULTISPECIES: hypothetical protein [Enterocloster]
MSLVIFLIANDRIILVLGGLLFICCVFRSRSIWTLISNDRYEMVEGVCSGVTSPPFRRYRKIHLLDGNGAEFTLLLDRNARFHIGTPYRFYFQKDARPLVGNPYLDASLSTNTFLGYEEIQVSDINESKSEEN